MNAAELRGKSEKELRDEVLALRRGQFNLRLQQGINPDGVRSDRITRVRKDIARIKTVLREQEIDKSKAAS